jgi:ATP-dependent helicase HrpA
MILAARDHDCLTEMLIIASALSVQDPRDRPMEAQAAGRPGASQVRRRQVEFLSWLKIWKWFEDAIEHKKTNRQLQDNCRANFLSQMRLREWRDVHTQLLTMVREQGWRLNEAPATYDQLHMALLTGLLGNIGYKIGRGRRRRLSRRARHQVPYLARLLAAARRPASWTMAAELVETTRLYARTIAQIQPEWLERSAAIC